MTKTEAAEILIPALNTYARKQGRTHIDKEFYEAYLSEAKHLVEAGSPIAQAVEVRPSWRFIRSQAATMRYA